MGLSLDEPMPDLLRFVEDDAGVPVAVVELGHGLAGAYVRQGDGGVIFVNAGEALVRQRFTLAHELGHHVLGHESVIDPSADLEGWSNDPREVEANRFAAELLAPRAATEAWAAAELDGEPNLEDVVRFACDFRISAAAARIRLATAGALKDAERIERLDGEIERSEHRRLATLLGIEPKPDGLSAANEHTPRLPPGDSALLRYARGEISLGQLAQAAGTDVAGAEAMAAALGLLLRASG